MGENKTLNFEMNQTSAPLLYHISLLNDQKQDINLNLSGKTAEVIDDLPYEKTKAQRILAKTIATNTDQQQIGKYTIAPSASATTFPINNTKTIPVSTLDHFITKSSCSLLLLSICVHLCRLLPNLVTYQIHRFNQLMNHLPKLLIVLVINH